MAISKEEQNSRQILRILTLFSIAFIIGALCARDRSDMLAGFVRINTNPSQFTRDYFKLGGLAGSFFNTGLIGLACCGLLYFTKAKCTGLTVAAYWLNTGFGTFGMTFLTIWPFFLGVYVYSRIKKVRFGSVANIAMFSTALAPFAGELMLRYPTSDQVGFSFPGILAALVLGIIVGCCMPSLCAHAPNFHKGYDLYSAGPAAGFLAFIVYAVLYRSTGIPVPSNTDLGEGERSFVNIFFIICFVLLLIAALVMDHQVLSKYKALWVSDGYKTDYTSAFGMPVAMVNMSLYGLFILLYYNVVHGYTVVDGNWVWVGARFTGATMGAIMCMYAFCCQGAQPRTVFPIMVGYALASLLPLIAFKAGVADPALTAPNWNLTTQAILVGLCFASGLAPISGKFGFWAGVAAGAMHATLVMSTPLLHGGFCLYNGGFTCGIVCFLLVPVLECFFGTKEERLARRGQ